MTRAKGGMVAIVALGMAVLSAGCAQGLPTAIRDEQPLPDGLLTSEQQKKAVEDLEVRKVAARDEAIKKIERRN